MSAEDRKENKARGEGGVALLSALLVTALMTVIVMQFTFRTQVEHRRTAQWVNAKRAELLADSGLVLAAQLLEFDNFTDRLENKLVDHLGETWAGTVGPIRDEFGGEITFVIEDDSARYDLNRLRTPSIRERERAERLFSQAQVERALLGPLIDWIDADSAVFPVPEGAEADYYGSLPRPYRPRNQALRTFPELALLRGITPIDLVKLRAVATVTASTERRINLNTAPPGVLRAILPGLDDETTLAAFLTSRQASPFYSLDDVGRIPGMNEAAVRSIGTVKSEYFRVRSTGGADGAYQSVEAVLRREDTGIQLVYWARRRGPNVPAADSSVQGDLDDFSVFAGRR